MKMYRRRTNYDVMSLEALPGVSTCVDPRKHRDVSEVRLQERQEAQGLLWDSNPLAGPIER